MLLLTRMNVQMGQWWELENKFTTAMTGIRTPRFPALLDAWRDKNQPLNINRWQNTNSSAIFYLPQHHSVVPSEQGLCLRPSRWLFSLRGPAERKAPAGWRAARPPFAQLEDWPLYYPGHLSQPRSSVYMQKRGNLNKFDTCSHFKHQCNRMVLCVTCIRGPCSLW